MTAQEFISAVQAGSTIEVDSDIDFNDYQFTSSIGIPDQTIIKGNGHTLTNIQQGNNDIFELMGAISINRLNFRNINSPSHRLFAGRSTSTDKIITECQFSGIASYLYGGTNNQITQAITFNRCSITLDRYTMLTGTYKECYMVLTRNINTTDVIMFGERLEHTYLKGEITMSGSTIKRTYMVGSCFNINVKGDYTLNFNNVDGNEISIVNTDKLEGNFTPSSQTIGVTDAEMHDAAALYNKGFNIYVP